MSPSLVAPSGIHSRLPLAATFPLRPARRPLVKMLHGSSPQLLRPLTKIIERPTGFFELTSCMVNGLGGSLVVIGAVFATVNIARYIFNRVAGTQLRTLFPFHSQRNEPGYREPVKLVHIRLQLGSFCRMGLELLVV
eukprot:CAMPEP_0185754370 /NCGR_PEP_ID=MMETSP1174-20130828/13018_1 /TAXON_ID=35687 /ORGANISM="Dictyocha speculum, Strain CCMP1381" /LENGTH=136 /DNA_ID=CAMNT_0028432545 /DNA_START=1 /DNA_END=408 /DNA_ORIENTATION=+